MAPPKAASKEEIAAFMAKVSKEGADVRKQMEGKLEAEQAAANSVHTATIKVPENKWLGFKKSDTRTIKLSS